MHICVYMYIYIYMYIIHMFYMYLGGASCATLLVQCRPFRVMCFSLCPTPPLETPPCEARPIEKVALHK